MEQTLPQIPLPQTKVVSYAGFWKRLASHMIDQIIISVVGIIIIIPFIGMVGLSLWTQDFDPDAGFFFTLISAYVSLIILIVSGEWLYYAIMESKKGATLGKMVLGIAVTDLNGNRITFGRATGRYFAKIISGLILMIGYIMAGFTQQKQALHDIIAGCLVINKPIS